MAAYSPKPNVLDGVILSGSICMTGASQVYPHLNATVGFLLFWGGLAGVALYPAYRWGLHYARSGVAWPDLFAFLRPGTERISALGFLATAEKRFGWDFGGKSLDPIELQLGLRQAAVDGDIVFFGRTVPESMPNDMVHHFPLKRVPGDTVGECELVIVGREKNQDTKLWHPKNGVQFVDLHLERARAMRWLSRSANAYRGTWHATA